jgi:phospholipid-binding lipoprotein MlaA
MLSTAPAPVRAQDESELTTKTQNPVADLIAMIPFRLTNECNVITPTTAPVIYPPESAPGVGEGVGFGDIQLSRGPLPSKPDAIIWGASAILQGPTATDDGLGKWGALPTIPALTVQGPRAVGTCIHSEPIIATDWKADADDRWTAPADATLLDRPVPPASAPPAVVRPEAGELTELEDYDPWEKFNEKIFEFNRRMDKHALKPVAMGWKTVVPQPAGIMIANAFDNLTVVPRVVNNLLQGKWNGAGREVTRFVINSTAGIGGLLDPAKDVWHITKSPADFGQTLGKWGIAPGPYLVLPLMEPLTVRDGIGKAIDRTIDPLTYVVPLIPALSLVAGNRVNERALNYELFAAFDDEVIDAYSAVRNGYLRLRERRVNE